MILETERLARLSGSATLKLGELAGSLRDGLMGFCCTAGLVVVGQLMKEEMTERIGPKGRHDPGPMGTRKGTAPGFAVLGGRSVAVRRPRAPHAGCGEVQLDSYEVLSSTDLMTEMAVERMLAGVAARRHSLVAEPLGEAIEEVARGGSKSAVCRRFVNATIAKLEELLDRDLSGLDVAVLMIDGILFAEWCCVVALLVTADGTKVPVGLWEDGTKTATVVTDLLADLVERGLGYEKEILCILGGRLKIVYGLLTSEEGVPVANEVFKGNTGDPAMMTPVVRKDGPRDETDVGDREALFQLFHPGGNGRTASAAIFPSSREKENEPSAISRRKCLAILTERHYRPADPRVCPGQGQDHAPGQQGGQPLHARRPSHGRSRRADISSPRRRQRRRRGARTCRLSGGEPRAHPRPVPGEAGASPSPRKLAPAIDQRACASGCVREEGRTCSQAPVRKEGTGPSKPRGPCTP